MNRITRYVRFWDATEHPRSLALIRIFLGLCIVYDLTHLWSLDLVVPLYGVKEVGGLWNPLSRSAPPWIAQVVPATIAGAQLFHGAMLASALSFLFGFFSRSSAFLLLVLCAQFEALAPAANRGIETLFRDVLLVLMFSGCGKCWSVDAWLSTGRWSGDGTHILAFARRLLILQIVVMYFMAGVQKVGITWWPLGHFAALYFVLQDPAIAAFDFYWIGRKPWFLLTQVGTAVTVVYQWTYPVVLLFLYYQATPDQGGRLRAFSNRWRPELLWIGTGAAFHLGLAWTTNLGIFPWMMLSLYPAFVHPDTLKSWLDAARARIVGATPP